MLKYNHNNLKNAKELRKNMTPWECKLWFNFLKNLPIKVYKQKPIGNYIIDFYCPKHKLAIELDGSQHYSQEKKIYDTERTKFLSSLGIRLVRYTNIEVDKQFQAVCEDILRKLNMI